MTLRVPESVVNRFVSLNPSPDDRQSVLDLVSQLLKRPELGIPIPFNLPEYSDCYVAFTPNRKWRVVYRRLDPEGIVVCSIDREGTD